MTRKRLKMIYVLTFVVWSVILFFLLPVHQDVIPSDHSYYFLWSVWIFTAMTFIYVHLFITKQIFLNLLLTASAFLFYGAGSFLTAQLILFAGEQTPDSSSIVHQLPHLEFILSYSFILLFLELARFILPKNIRVPLHHSLKKSEPQIPA